MMYDMRKFILFSILILSLGLKSYSQQISQSVMSSGGGDFTSVYVENVQFTVGQPYVTNPLTDGKNTWLTQGYQQPSMKGQDIISPEFPDLELVKLDLYPNPAINYTDLILNLINDDGAKVSLIDMWGQVLKSEDFKVLKGHQKMHFAFGSVAAGIYTIKINANERVYARKLLVNVSGTGNL